MTTQSTVRFPKVILSVAAIVIVLAAMKAAAPIIVPFILAAFVSLLCAIPLFWLYPRLCALRPISDFKNTEKVASSLSVMIVVTLLLGLFAAVGFTAGSSMRGFYAELPTYRMILQGHTEDLLVWLSALGLDTEAYRDSIAESFNPASAINIAGMVIKSMSRMLTNGFMILLTVLFILLEAVAMPRKMAKVVQNPEATFSSYRKFVKKVKRYLLVKMLTSLVTAILITVSLHVIGIDFPVLWGMVAFALNFVPNIGSIIAAIPALLIAVVQFGLGAIVPVGIVYLVVNILIGSILEPRIMGGEVGLSPLVVFLSLVFWGWILGPVGMLLSVPLTMIVKIGCESSKSLKHVAILLGPPDGVEDGSEIASEVRE